MENLLQQLKNLLEHEKTMLKRGRLFKWDVSEISYTNGKIAAYKTAIILLSKKA